MVFPYFTFSIGVTTASAAILGLGMQRKIRQLKSDWKNQRCKPHGMLAAGIPGVRPSGVSASQNYKECQLGMFQGFFNTLITPITAIISVITDLLTDMINSINHIRTMITHVRNGLMNALGSIASKIYNMSVRIAWLFKQIIIIVGNIFNIFIDLFGILKYAFYTMSTIWNGTVGAVLKFFSCFDPTTEIDLDNSTIKIKNIKVGDILKDNTEVTGVIKIRSNGVEMYNYKDIIVSGSHLINEDGKWLRIEDSRLSYKINYKKKYIYCLSTSTAKISIKNQIYADYIETTNKELLHYMYNLILNKLNNHTDLETTTIKTDETLYQWGVGGNTFINTLDGKKKIRNCKIGDVLSESDIIRGIVKFKISNYDEQPLYNYCDVVCTGSMIIYENEEWMPVFNSTNATKITDRPKYMYNIISTSNTFRSNNVVWCDFEQTNDSTVNDTIDAKVIENIT